jgi:haloalkane dehalogenase
MTTVPMKIVQTPAERFVGLPGWPYDSVTVEVEAGDDSPRLRMAAVDEGPRGAPVVLLLHGEPSWSYLYRKMIGPLVAAGYRVVAPDLVGFGRSDKPTERTLYTYARHVAWVRALVDALGLDGITLFCQDWGGLIGLRLVGEQPDRFARVCAANTFLPTGDRRPPDAFFAWQQFSQTVPELPVGGIVRRGCAREMPDDVAAAYDAPYPSEESKAGARQFPTLVPTSPDDPAAPANRRAWEGLARYTRPFLTLFGDSDPITRGGERALQAKIPGAAGQPHATIARAGHFLQEDAGEELADRLVAWMR